MIAVITAGGRVEGAFAHAIGTHVKALAPIGSGRLLDAAIDTSRLCGASSVAVVGDAEVGSYCGARIDTLIPAVADGGENLAAALRSARSDEPLLLLTSDLPFLTAPALADFLARVGDAEVAMPLALPAAYLTAYPGVSGSVFYFAPGSAVRALEIARKLFAARKSLLRLATLLDGALLLRFCIGRLRVAHVEDYAARRFGIHARGVVGSAPELCYDVDTLTDYRYALERLGRSG
jgi:GTP:adenosylcobinamide-phosphate guanylyltransferase